MINGNIRIVCTKCGYKEMLSLRKTSMVSEIIVDMQNIKATWKIFDKTCLCPSCKEADTVNAVSYKSLAYGFLDLSYLKQCEIIKKLSLGREEDKGLKHIQIIDKFIKRAEEEKCIDEFWREVQRRAE